MDEKYSHEWLIKFENGRHVLEWIIEDGSVTKKIDKPNTYDEDDGNDSNEMTYDDWVQWCKEQKNWDMKVIPKSKVFEMLL